MLDSLWAHLPRLELPITEDAWQPYVEAIQQNGNRLDFELMAVIDSAPLNASISRLATEREHRQALISSIRRGQLRTLSPRTRLQTDEYQADSIVTTEALTQYVAQFHIAVRFAVRVDDLPEIYRSQAAKKQAAGRYTLEEAANLLEQHAGERASTLLDKLGRAAFEGTLPVYQPGENARHEYVSRPPGSRVSVAHHPAPLLPGGIFTVVTDWQQCVRSFYEEAYWDDLNKWLDAKEPRISWRFPTPNPKLPGSSTPSELPAQHGVHGDNRPTSGNQCSVFLDMQNLSANEVHIAFVGDKFESAVVGNGLLEISARGETRRVAFSALELVDRRSGRLNSLGVILLGMAQKGTLTRTERKAATMARLRRVFRKHLGISADPFEPYRKPAGWVARFTISDKRGAADERAIREAERRTDSYEQLNETGEKNRDTHGRQPLGSENDATSDWLERNDTDEPA